MTLQGSLDRFEGCLLGLATGDAVGTTLEFSPRGSFEPITDMEGGGPFNLIPGQWTDDTSMALCLAHSLLEKQAFDPFDQMNRYCNWRDYGYLSSTGTCFDIGNTVNRALNHYLDSGEPIAGPTDPKTAGNGSIMRLAPIIQYYFPNWERVRHFAIESSKTTHGAEECLQCCELLADVLFRALSGMSKSMILDQINIQGATNAVQSLTLASWRKKTELEIQGTGYVVDSLEAALWSFDTTNSFEECILAAANLGDDADTTAAIAGQIAGAYYGRAAIPKGWLAKLYHREDIQRLASELFHSGQ